MAIGFRASSSGDVHTPGTTITITKPAATASTDILIAQFGSGRSSASACGFWDAPSGWAAVGSVHNVANGTNRISGDVYWALGNVANLGFTKNVGGAADVSDMGWVCLAFTGVDNTTPIDATGTANSNTASATLTTNLVTVVTSGAWHLIGFNDWLGGTFTATGFTPVQNASANETSSMLYNTTPKSTGSTGTVIVTSSAASTGQVLIGIPFALRASVASSPYPSGYNRVFTAPMTNTLIRL